MSQIIHDVSFPNDGNGDELRTAFVNQNTMNTELYTTKVDKVVGKELSTNDYTNTEKAKLAGIAAGAEVNVQADWNQNDNLQDDYIKNKPTQMFASVGYFDHNDLATQTTPITLTSGVNIKLTNDTLGAFTDLTQAPYGVSNIWNSTTNQFDFSSLDVGDTLDLRVDCFLTTTGTNKTYKIFLKLGIGTASEYTTLVGSGELKAAVTNENIVKEIGFYLGSEDIKNYPAELYVLVDTTGSIKVNGWYTRILRKSVNIVGIEGDDLKQDVLTETNFGAFANGLTTEDTIADGDLINYTDVSDTNKQKKTTWANIKSKLALLFQYKLTAGTNITIDNTDPLNPIISASGGGGSSEIILNYQLGTAVSLNTTERVASTTGLNAVNFSENVTKSGSLLTGPYYMLAQNITKTGTISKLRYRYFPDSTDLSIELRVYCFKQNANSTSIYDCRLMLDETLTATTAYTTQKFEFLTADFLDADTIDGEFLVVTCKKVGAASYTLLSQNLTIIY